MDIREAKLEDLDKLLQLLYQLSQPSEDEKNADTQKLRRVLNKIIEDENYYICIFEYDGELFGTGMLLVQLNLSHKGKPFGHIENVVMDEKHRKKGIGLKIIEYLIEKAKEKNCYKVILNCKKNNIPFYEKTGLKENGEVEMRLDF